MKRCDGHKLRIARYLDDELRGPELADFESHLHGCAVCRAALAEEQRFLDKVRSAGALCDTEGIFRAAVEEGIESVTPYKAPPHLRDRVRKIIEQAMIEDPKGWRPFLQAILVLLFARLMV